MIGRRSLLALAALTPTAAYAQQRPRFYAKGTKQRAVRFAGSDGATLAGTVARVPSEGGHHELLLHLERPAPGVALLGTFAWDGKVQTSIGLYFYGDDAAAAAAAARPVWRAWLDERFPALETAATAAAE